MHASLRGIGVLSDLKLIVVPGFGFSGWAPPQTLHDPALLVLAGSGTVTLIEMCSGSVGLSAAAMDQCGVIGIFMRQYRAR
jgi:hypothetical protein